MQPKPETGLSSTRIVEHFFRHESAKILAHLSRIYGAQYLELIEDSLQEAFIKAMQVWPYKMPGNPSGWILQVARNKVTDQLRRQTSWKQKQASILAGQETHQNEQPPEQVLLDNELNDDLLRMVFACCNPNLSTEQQLILSLRILCGFSNNETARALLKNEEAVAKAYQRAKAKLKEEYRQDAVPVGTELQARLDGVLSAIYLLFNEGYSLTEGDKLVSKDICMEAIRLCKILTGNIYCDQPEVHALLALMYFHTSRIGTRIDPEGNLLPLQHQDRNLWDREMIASGVAEMQKADYDKSITTYHLQAAIASCHSIAPGFEDTDWLSILRFYDLMMEMQPSGVVAMNRAVAHAKVTGPDAAIKDLDEFNSVLQNNHLYYAIRSELLEEAGHHHAAYQHLQKAIEMSRNEKEKAYLNKKLELIGKGK